MDETRRRALRTLLMAGVMASIRAPGALWAAEELAFPVSPLTIETARGRFQFIVEMAETPSTWRQGLQKREHLAQDAGMLFDYHESRVVSMWMKDTLISLDMVFIDDRGAVINVAENTVPMSLTPISSDGPALAVLEVNAGTVARLGLHPGDRVYHAIFSPQPAPAR